MLHKMLTSEATGGPMIGRPAPWRTPPGELAEDVSRAGQAKSNGHLCCATAGRWERAAPRIYGDLVFPLRSSST